MKTFFLKFAAIALLLPAACNKEPAVVPDQPSAQTTVTIGIDGRTRSYIRYLPTGWNNTRNMPLVMVLHGGTLGNPENMLANADFRPLAEAEKFVAIYPAGIENNWNDGRPTDANLLGVDDVSFCRQLIDQLINEFNIDPGAVFVTGISNGGFMASRLACELSDKVAAIGVVAATIEANTIYPTCAPSNAVAALYIHGTADRFVPIAGGEMTLGDGGFIVSHTAAIAKWLLLNNITSAPVITNLPDIADDGTTITETRYTNPATGIEVIGYVILNGGHTWPQGTGPNYPNLVGLRSMDMNATEVIWEFFKPHKRN